MSEGASGLLVLDKPAGMTSHDVVARVRRALGVRKVGHAGTLDPMATGVLLLGVGRATRLLGHLTLTTKAYDARMRLGVTTTTDDAEGDTVSTADVAALTEDRVRGVLEGFRGELEQVPSAVSAIKVDGRRAYARVREGETVDLPPRRVTVHRLDVGPVELPEASFSLTCTSGTYVRAIARDAGQALGVGAHLVALRRTAVGPFTLDDAVAPAQVDASSLLGLALVAPRCFATLVVDGAEARNVRHGRPLLRELPDGAVRAVIDPVGEFLALYAAHPSGTARAVAVLA